MQRPNDTFVDNERLRMLACVAASLLLAIATVNLWPASTHEPELAPLYSPRGQEVIEVTEVIPTRQQRRQPPPPAPLPPVEVADEELLEIVDLELESPLIAEDFGDELEAAESTADTSAPLPRSQSQARLVRFTPPTYPDEARRRRVRAEILVEVDIDERGVVRDARVLKRFLLGKDEGDRELVDHVGFGLEESAIEAAMASQYRPARENGRPVRSLMELYVTFGT